MPIIKLTQQLVDDPDQLQCPEGCRKIEWVCAQRTGLYLLVTNTGQKTYFLRTKVHGRTKHFRLGNVTEMSLADARAKVKIIRAELALGKLPGDEQASDKACPSLSAYFSGPYMDWARIRNRGYSKKADNFRLYIEPTLGDKPINELSHHDIQQLHLSMKERGYSGATADHVLKLIRHVCNHAVANGVLSENPARYVKQYNDFNQVQNRISDDDLRRLLTVLNNHPNRQISGIILLLIATGCRVGEILSAKWSNCDRENRVLKIPKEASKSRKERHVPLNPSAMEVINRLDTQDKYDYLFINKKFGKPYVNINKTWYQIRREAGLDEKSRLHDLRHLFGSRLASQGESIYVISKLLGHASVITSHRYSVVSDQALHKASAHMSDILSNTMNDSE